MNIKPCPFCGEPIKPWTNKSESRPKGDYIYSSKKGAKTCINHICESGLIIKTGYHFLEYDAIREWNNRV